ncbi:uncharacterized protein [Miscanthus floridulus]|uniref:uncharacterized protein n=1 Tax=Miscanthus floridulus TaxID=154761 RepID=UPI003458533A
MRHPTDSKAWKHVDNKYGWFAKEARNIRLGLASDGFNPFGMQNVTYTTWPVILIPYNLPPWLFEKQPYWIMSMLIPSPKSLGMNIDVYLRPLIDELKDLWEKGIDTWDDKKLLPLVVRKILPKEVVMPLIQLSRFFSALCSKELVEEDLDKLSSSIKETLCQLEMVFPPALFDIMIHLSVHLAEEAKLGGPMCYRWMYPIERCLRTVKGYVRNKAHPKGSIAEGYIAKECLTFCSRFLDVDTKLNHAYHHESTIVNELPSGLSITKLYRKGEASELMYDLSQGPDHRACVFNRCYINNWLFRTTTIERNLITQNSGVLVRGDGTTNNMTWYGVIRRMISLEFPAQKEVLLFQCDWYDVPAASTSRSRGYSRDKYGVIDIDTCRFRYSNKPYILATQAEPVFFVNLVNKPGWSSVVAVRPRNLFAMPEAENEGDMEVDLLDVGIQDMNLLGPNEDLSNWTRPDKEGTTGDASIINQVRGEAVLKPDDAILLDDDDDEDDTNIDDGVVAPVVVESIEDDFFV